LNPELLIPGGFRCHLLIPNTAVGTIDEDKPTEPWLTVRNGIFAHKGRPVLELRKMWPGGGELFVKATALQDVWIQEPGLSVKIAGDGVWQGYGRDGEWTSIPRPLARKDAHKETVHFSRVKSNKDYTVGVEFRWSQGRYRFRSDGGFQKPLNKRATPNAIPWVHCEVFNNGYYLNGTAEGYEILRRWELAGHMPDQSWMHFLGWTGGAGVVTNSKGRTPPPGSSPTVDDGYDRLWQPKSWRKLAKGQSIAQSLTTIRIKGVL
jgi:hypothetical protein